MSQMLKPSEIISEVLAHHSPNLPHYTTRARAQAGHTFFALFDHSPACTPCHRNASTNEEERGLAWDDHSGITIMNTKKFISQIPNVVRCKDCNGIGCKFCNNQTKQNIK